MTLRSTHTFSVLEISPAAYAEIRGKLIDAGYGHTIMRDGSIDMDGIGVAAETVPVAAQPKHEEETLP